MVKDSTKKILILAANPNGLRLDQEIRDIEDSIRRGIRREQFQVATRLAVRPKDIRRAIAEERPQIVHFCGHGTVDGSLVLEDDTGQIKPVKPEGLAALFELYSDDVDCVLMNACYSEKSAEKISQYINYVIGMNQAVNDKTAIKFAEGFYDALGYGIENNNQERFQRAFKEGIIATMLEDLPGFSVPVFKKKATVIRKDSCCATEASNIERELITTSLKYFYYISKSKMEMLLPQFNLISNGNVVSDVLNLSNVLSIHGLIEDAFHPSPLKTSSFYHYSGVVKQGLFSTCGDEVLTTYLLWTIFGNSLFLLFGSPRNILGNEFAWEDVRINWTTNTTYFGLSNLFNKIIETNDSWSQNLYENSDYLEFKRPHPDSQSSEDDFLQTLRDFHGLSHVTCLTDKKDKKAAGAGLLCFQLLKDLPDSSIDTIFKVFSHYELADKDSQLLKEIYRTEFSSDQDIIERDQAIIYNWNLKNVYIGSPLYVSIA